MEVFYINIYINKFGEDYVSLGLLYLNMGLLHYNKTDHDEAELYYKNALRIYNLSFDNNHPNIGRIYNNLGLLATAKEQDLYLFFPTTTSNFTVGGTTYSKRWALPRTKKYTPGK